MKLLATVHQFHLPRDVFAGPVLEAYQAHRFGDTFDVANWEHYQQQGEVAVEVTPQNVDDVLEDIFSGGNDSGYGPLGNVYNRFSTAYSISVGDVIILGELAFRVANFGFEPVELPR